MEKKNLYLMNKSLLSIVGNLRNISVLFRHDQNGPLFNKYNDSLILIKRSKCNKSFLLRLIIRNQVNYLMYDDVSNKVIVFSEHFIENFYLRFPTDFGVSYLERSLILNQMKNKNTNLNDFYYETALRVFSYISDNRYLMKSYAKRFDVIKNKITHGFKLKEGILVLQQDINSKDEPLSLIATFLSKGLISDLEWAEYVSVNS